MKEDKQAGLKYHWTNPKFEGKSWAVDKGPKTRKPSCVKKPYDTEQEAAKERFVLVAAEHKNFFGKAIKWGYEFCEECKAFHITRE